MGMTMARMMPLCDQNAGIRSALSRIHYCLALFWALTWAFSASLLESNYLAFYTTPSPTPTQPYTRVR